MQLTPFRYNVPIQINTNDKVKNRVNGSVEFLRQHLENGEVVYGEQGPSIESSVVSVD